MSKECVEACVSKCEGLQKLVRANEEKLQVVKGQLQAADFENKARLQSIEIALCGEIKSAKTEMTEKSIEVFAQVRKIESLLSHEFSRQGNLVEDLSAAVRPSPEP